MSRRSAREGLIVESVAEAQEHLELAQMSLRAAVATARADGASWADIGRTLGITRQAAADRFGPPKLPLG
jgi:hypothetical protein